MRGDLEIKRQLVVALAVAATVTLGEALLYYRVIVPEVQGGVRSLLEGSLRLPEEGLPRDPVARDTLRAWLGTAAEREHILVRANNAATLLTTAVILAGPLCLLGALFAFSGPLRRSPKGPLVADWVAVVAFIGVFELLFYRLGHSWAYPDGAELAVAVADHYGPAPPCASCTHAVEDTLARSPLLRAARATQPGDVLRQLVDPDAAVPPDSLAPAVAARLRREFPALARVSALAAEADAADARLQDRLRRADAAAARVEDRLRRADAAASAMEGRLRAQNPPNVFLDMSGA